MTKRLLAKGLFTLGGWLSHIKTPQRVDRATLRINTTPAGWHWFSCRLSMTLLRWSTQLDWRHWDHWATYCDHDHDGSRIICNECGGFICPIKLRA